MTTTLNDLVVGTVFDIPADGPLTHEEIIAYAQQYDPHPARLDNDATRRAPAGRLAASEWHIVGLAQSALVKAVLKDSFNNGSPGIERVRFHSRAYPGDRLSTRIKVARIDPWPRRKNIAKAKFDVSVRKADGTVVMTMMVLTLWPIPTDTDDGAIASP